MPVFFVFVLYLDPNDACVLSSFFTFVPMMPVFCFRSLPSSQWCLCFVFVLYLDPNDACVLSSFFTFIPMMPVFCLRSLPWSQWCLCFVFVLYLDPNDACVFELSIPDSPFGFLYCLFERLITGFVTRLKRRVQRVAQELPTLPEHPSSLPVFSGVRVTRSLVLYVCFVDRCLAFCIFSFGHCVVCSFSICGFWLPLWYLQTLLGIYKVTY